MTQDFDLHNSGAEQKVLVISEERFITQVLSTPKFQNLLKHRVHFERFSED
jgi:hypothetical protein